MKCPSCAHRLKKDELVMCAVCWAQVPAGTRERIATLYMADGSSDEYMDAVSAAAKAVKIA